MKKNILGLLLVAAQCVLSYLANGQLPDDVFVNYTYIKLKNDS